MRIIYPVRSTKIDKRGRVSDSNDDPTRKEHNKANIPLYSNEGNEIGSFYQKEEQKNEFEEEHLDQKRKK